MSTRSITLATYPLRLSPTPMGEMVNSAIIYGHLLTKLKAAAACCNSWYSLPFGMKALR